MLVDTSFYEDDFLDDEDLEFEKFSHRNKVSKRKQDNIQKKRKEKQKEKEQLLEESENGFMIL